MIFDSVHNYYEQLVLSKIAELQNNKLHDADEDFLCDVVCVALNQLPTRYVRHNVDMLFYMPIEEREKINQDVAEAIDKAIEYINQHKNEHSS